MLALAVETAPNSVDKRMLVARCRSTCGGLLSVSGVTVHRGQQPRLRGSFSDASSSELQEQHRQGLVVGCWRRGEAVVDLQAMPQTLRENVEQRYGLARDASLDLPTSGTNYYMHRRFSAND